MQIKQWNWGVMLFFKCKLCYKIDLCSKLKKLQNIFILPSVSLFAPPKNSWGKRGHPMRQKGHPTSYKSNYDNYIFIQFKHHNYYQTFPFILITIEKYNFWLIYWVFCKIRIWCDKNGHVGCLYNKSSGTRFASHQYFFIKC